MAEALSSLQLALLAQEAADQRRLLAAEPIAVVGMGCRFPAGPGHPDLDSPETFWSFLLAGREAVSEVPDSRWPLDRFYSPSPGTPGKMHCRHGAFLAAPELFDPARFGISPREAQAIDPQHRLLLEVSQEALERAGFAGDQLRGQSAGVYFGICTGDYAWRQLRGDRPDSGFDMYFATGTSFAMAPGRLAYALGLRGPALAIDTACSSSLVAVDLACRSLRDRTTDVALAGGVSLLLTPVNSLCFARSGMMAADGHCKTFDAAADGYVRGEGCGVVVLKRLSDALAAGDPVLAVVRGSAVNQDGASAGLTVPNGEAQAALIRSCLEQAQLRPEHVGVLEAHGTGTPLGDPIELKALAPIYGSRDRPQPLRLGSVKTNLGHLEGAAGIAGFLKAVLMVQKGSIPPHLHLRQPTPYLSWDDWALRIPTVPEPWPEGPGLRRAAVSSFGFSGTNAHVVLEQAAPELQPPPPQPASPLVNGDWLLLSAGSAETLQELAARLAAWLPHQPESAWSAICATSRRSRSGLRWRLAIQARTAADALRRLREPWQALEAPAQAPPLAFRLTGQSNAGHWEAWAGFGITATALVVGSEQRQLALRLAGTPPQLRLIELGATAADELQRHGYGVPIPLQEPTSDALVQLWLRGIAVQWQPLEPQGVWPKQVLPTIPFDRIRCWVDEFADQPAAEPLKGLDALQLQRHWSALVPAVGPPASHPWVDSIWVFGASPPLREHLAAVLPRPPLFLADLESLDAQLASHQGAPALLLLAVPSGSPALDASFWEQWLPLLTGLAARSPRLQGVHWLLQASPAGTPAGEAWAALARCWARELGSQAGGLFWCGAHGEGLERLLQHPQPPVPGSEWRLGPDGTVQVAALLPQEPPAALDPPRFAPTATTLITGGLGALGLASVEVLHRCGARHFTLVSRHLPSEAQRQKLAALEQVGVGFSLEQLDVADAPAVEDLFARLLATGRPLAGIIHAAGVLDDGLLMNQTASRCAAVAAVKVQGVQHLDRCSRNVPHGFFVVYSSLAAALGSPGQVAYGAANGWMDGLMLQRLEQGLPALTINWGPWAGEGMAARQRALVRPLERQEAQALLLRWLPQRGRVVLARLESAQASHPLAARLQQVATQLPGLSSEQAGTLIQRALRELLAELGGFVPADLAPDVRLDELGLDSLMAVELAAAVQGGLGVSLGLGALDGVPTLESLSEHLLALLADPGALGDGSGPDLGIEAELPSAWLSRLRAGITTEGAPHGPGEAILMTGASGFLGAFLLADQLQRHPHLSVYCLVRADGAGAARARVRSNLERYGLWTSAWASRIIGVPGDLAKPGLGISAEVWQGVASHLGGILHNGAQLSYVAPYGQLRAANVGGTREIVRLAIEAAVPLEFISSTAVFEAEAYRGQSLDEGTELRQWRGIHLGYSQTKWVSERLVWLAAEAGLPVRLYRPPLIAGHSQTGAWHQQDFLHRLVRGCLALGQAPDLEMELDLVPVDYVSAAVGALAWTPLPPMAPTPADVLHLQHPQPVLWGDLLKGLIERGAPLQAVDLDPWLEALSQQPHNPLYPLQPFFTQRWGSEQLTYPQLNQPGFKARPSCQRSLDRLRGVGVSCPSFDQLLDPYARTFLEDLLAHG